MGTWLEKVSASWHEKGLRGLNCTTTQDIQNSRHHSPAYFAYAYYLLSPGTSIRVFVAMTK
jgi:hypothetical protein